MTRDARRPSRIVLPSLLFLLVTGTAFTTDGTVLIGHGGRTTWKYLDDGGDPGEAWRESSFDDSRWKSGPGPLGHDEEDLGTRVNVGGEPAPTTPTTYFRREFQVSGPGPRGMLLVLIRCDDGAVVHLNARELARANMDSGTVTHETRARRRIEGSAERKYHRFIVPGNALVPGRNVIAVQVHQWGGMGDDLFFDCLLKEYSKGEEPRPGKVVFGAKDVTLTYHRKHYVGPELRIPDGYRDGGRAMVIGADDGIKTLREVLVVDRAADPALRKHLDFARTEELKGLEPLERARRIAKYIQGAMSGREDPSRLMDDVELFQAEYEDREVLIGEIDAGVCRHEALLFKLMADEAGLQAALVRGNYRGLGGGGGHAWNELVLDGGRKLLVDVTNPPPDLRFPETGARTARRYLSVRNEPLYAAKDAASGEKRARADRTALLGLARLPWARVPVDEKDPGQSEAALRRAIDSGAAEEVAWSRLVAILIRAKRFEDLRSLGKARLEREDSARARLALAKALEGLDRPEEAGIQVKEALERQPDDLYANLAAAVLALRQGDDHARNAGIQEKLQKAQAAVTKAPSREGFVEFHVIVALHMSLSGNEDAAVQVLENVLARDPGHEEAKRLYEALE